MSDRPRADRPASDGKAVTLARKMFAAFDQTRLWMNLPDAERARWIAAGRVAVDAATTGPRDHFAGAAMAALLSRSTHAPSDAEVAREAYEIADAMLVERSKGKT